MLRDVMAAVVLLWGCGLACANGNPAPADDLLPPPPVANDDPPSAQAVAAYLAEVLASNHVARRTSSGYAVLGPASRVMHTVDIALTSHQCWKVKDGYQCRSTVRTTTTPASGRPRQTLLEVSNDYQWRGGRLFSARLEAMRPQTVAQAGDDAAAGTAQGAGQAQPPGASLAGNSAAISAANPATGRPGTRP